MDFLNTQHAGGLFREIVAVVGQQFRDWEIEIVWLGVILISLYAGGSGFVRLISAMLHDPQFDRYSSRDSISPAALRFVSRHSLGESLKVTL